VVKILDKAVYQIQCDDMACKRLIVHSNRLKHYYGKHSHSPAPKSTGTSSTKESGNNIQRSNDEVDNDLLIDVQVQHNTELEGPTQSLPEIEDKEQSES
jgi:hypothetical protein